LNADSAENPNRLSSDTAADSPPTNETPITLTVSAEQAAVLCGVSRTHWYTLKAAGRLPKPIRLGNRTMWVREEIERWLGNRCPSQEQWEQIRGNRKT